MLLALGLIGARTSPTQSAGVDPVFSATSTNPFGLTDVGLVAVPALADIDGDGDLDVFVGNSLGLITFFRNTGSAIAPTFALSITNPFALVDVGSDAAPAFADIDGDGDLDAFVGNVSGDTIFFPNTGSVVTPTFPGSSANPFGLANVAAVASPTFADIDGDGDLDAFIGEFSGSAFFFRNTGSATSPAFAAGSLNPFGLADVGYAARLTFADIDGDGDLDAFVGNNFGDTMFFRNTGTALSAAFATGLANAFGLTDAGSYAAPTLADIDGDGDLDALIGNYAGETLFFKNAQTAQDPSFRATSTNPFGLTNAGLSYAAPTFADIDGDGDLDAFVGRLGSYMLFFRNTGTKLSPDFDASSTDPFGLVSVGLNTAPAFADIDGDGDFDAFVGNSSGNTIFFRNTGSAIAPAFAASSSNPFGLTDVGLFATPTFVDIDADGDLDAFVGNSAGNAAFFSNTGTPLTPAFAASSANPFGLSMVAYAAAPSFADIDGDGDLDALIGNFYGNVAFFRNTGSAITPGFAASSANPFGLSDVGSNAVPALADIDADGDLDAFVGNSAGDTVFFRNFVNTLLVFVPSTRREASSGW